MDHRFNFPVCGNYNVYVKIFLMSKSLIDMTPGVYLDLIVHEKHIHRFILLLAFEVKTFLVSKYTTPKTSINPTVFFFGFFRIASNHSYHHQYYNIKQQASIHIHMEQTYLIVDIVCNHMTY